jgi:hypothetical protein
MYIRFYYFHYVKTLCKQSLLSEVLHLSNKVERLEFVEKQER